jgi:hypothetical protein
MLLENVPEKARLPADHKFSEQLDPECIPAGIKTLVQEMQRVAGKFDSS